VLGACSSGPKRPVMHPAKPITREAPAAAPAGAPAAGSATSAAPPAAAPSVAPGPGRAAAAPAGGTANPTAPAHPQVSPAARADFDRVVSYMRAGKTVEAQLGFKQLSLQY